MSSPSLLISRKLFEGGSPMLFTARCAADFTPLGSLPGWLSALLRARGVNTEEEAESFLHPSLSGLHDPFLLSGMEKAVSLIRRAIDAREGIMIFGDYDADGVCAVSILLETLSEMGARVSFRLPDRRRDGYGLNENAVREIAGKPACSSPWTAASPILRRCPWPGPWACPSSSRTIISCLKPCRRRT